METTCKKWIVYKDLTYGPRMYYTMRGSQLSHTDPFHWSERVGLAHVFECPEEEMQDYVQMKAKQGNNIDYREIEDMELFIERLRG